MKAIFVHHPFHSKTKSFAFFAEVLESLDFKLTFISRDDFDVQILKGAKLLVLWQAEELLSYLADCEIQILCVPMLDETLPRNVKYFIKHKEIKYISFSRYLHHFLKFSGLESYHLQYWIQNLDVEKNHKKDQVFFWERNPTHLAFENVYKFALNNNLKLVYKIGADPHDASMSAPNFQDKDDLYVIDGWISNAELRQVYASSKYFISGRPWEGIGITMLEAISHGCVCLAFNNPTMNEYLDKSNGYLFKSAKNLEKIKVKNFETKQQNSREKNIVGFEEYALKISLLNEFLSKGSKNRRIRLLPSKLTLRNYIRFLKVFY